VSEWRSKDEIEWRSEEGRVSGGVRRGEIERRSEERRVNGGVRRRRELSPLRRDATTCSLLHRFPSSEVRGADSTVRRSAVCVTQSPFTSAP
jgi:hypothetical protein